MLYFVWYNYRSDIADILDVALTDTHGAAWRFSTYTTAATIVFNAHAWPAISAAFDSFAGAFTALLPFLAGAKALAKECLMVLLSAWGSTAGAGAAAFDSFADAFTALLPVLAGAKECLMALLSAWGSTAGAGAVSMGSDLVVAAPVVLAAAGQVPHHLLWCIWAGLWLGLALVALAVVMYLLAVALYSLLGWLGVCILDAHEHGSAPATWLMEALHLRAWATWVNQTTDRIEQAIDKPLRRMVARAQGTWWHGSVIACVNCVARVWQGLQQAWAAVCSRLHRCAMWYEGELQLLTARSKGYDLGTQCRPWLAMFSGSCAIFALYSGVAGVAAAVVCDVGGSPQACAKAVASLLWVPVLAVPVIAVHCFWSATLRAAVWVLEHGSSWCEAACSGFSVVAVALWGWMCAGGVAGAGLVWCCMCWCGRAAAGALRAGYSKVVRKLRTPTASAVVGASTQHSVPTSSTVGVQQAVHNPAAGQDAVPVDAAVQASLQAATSRQAAAQHAALQAAAASQPGVLGQVMRHGGTA
jgi:hypothetical protein